MKAVVFVVVAFCLLGFAAADDPEGSGNAPSAAELQAAVGADKAAILNNLPESSMKPMSSQECLEACDSTDSDPNNMPNVNSVKREMNGVASEISQAKSDVKKSLECVEELKQLEAELADLHAQKSALSGEDKRTQLESKVDLEERADTHVGSMIDTLRMKLTELQDAEREMNEKQTLTRQALEATKVDENPTPPVVDEGPYESTLAQELTAIHQGMVNSLEDHNQRVFNMSADIPGLHGLSHTIKGSQSAAAIAAKLTASGGKASEAIANAVAQISADSGRVVSQETKDAQIAKRKEVEKLNALIDGEKPSFREKRDLAKLRATVRKLKRKLRK